MGANRNVTLWSNVYSFGILTVMISDKVCFNLSQESNELCDGKLISMDCSIDLRFIHSNKTDNLLISALIVRPRRTGLLVIYNE